MKNELQFYYIENISDMVNMQKTNIIKKETFALGFL